MNILQFKTWLEDAGITHNDYSNAGGPFEKSVNSKNTAKSLETDPDDDIEKKNREKAEDNIKAFGDVSDLLRMKKMKKK